MAPDTAIEVLHRDDHLVVVNKPAGLLVTPAKGVSPATTVEHRLTRQLGQHTYPVHRLDQDTTGALLLALDLETKTALEALFRDHAIDRIYHALTSRVPDPPAGTIESRLHVGRDGVARSVFRGPGERAVTHYRTLARDRHAVLIECRLETGRRNQIRAHLSELGAPILGDRKYGWRARRAPANSAGSGPKRPLLHARHLGLVHPMSEQRVAVDAEPPPDFTQRLPSDPTS